MKYLCKIIFLVMGTKSGKPLEPPPSTETGSHPKSDVVQLRLSVTSQI